MPKSCYALSVFLVSFLLIFSCTKNEETPIDCNKLFFGIPGNNTGLSSDVCMPQCKCSGYKANDFTNLEIENLKSWILSSPPPLLEEDPYINGEISSNEGVCAIVIDNELEKTYHLENFSSKEEAEAAGAILTHYGLCGMCSSLQDLAVYVENTDLGVYTRNCGFKNILAPFDKLVKCLEAVGFTTPCAQIWSYNVKNTQTKCFDLCIDDILNEILNDEKTPFNNPDGSLNECIACDENLSGPIFKSYAGRTRRNSGLPSAICRKCDEVKNVEHDYPM